MYHRNHKRRHTSVRLLSIIVRALSALHVLTFRSFFRYEQRCKCTVNNYAKLNRLRYRHFESVVTRIVSSDDRV